jgi:hypothetical protein
LLGYFVWKITILRIQNHIFPNFRGGGARVGCAPLDPPLQTVIYKTLHKISNDRATRTREWTVLDPLVAPVVLLLLRWCQTFSSYQKCYAKENNTRVNVTLILTFIMLFSFPILWLPIYGWFISIYLLLRQSLVETQENRQHNGQIKREKR